MPLVASFQACAASCIFVPSLKAIYAHTTTHLHTDSGWTGRLVRRSSPGAGYVDALDPHLVRKFSHFLHEGRQHLGALFNLVAYYVLALPIGITLAFHPRTHLGLEGLWIGLSFSLFLLPPHVFTYPLRSDHLDSLLIRSSHCFIYRRTGRICRRMVWHGLGERNSERYRTQRGRSEEACIL